MTQARATVAPAPREGAKAAPKCAECTKENEQAGAGPGASFALGDVPILPKLVLGRPGDAEEADADRAARRVLRMRAPRRAETSEPTRSAEPVVRRKCAACEDDERRVERKTPSPSLAVQAGAGVAGRTNAVIHDALGRGEALPVSTRRFFEPRFGHDFSDVRVHHDAAAAEASRDVDALAFTYGRDIFFAAGRYAPGRADGDELLAHELAHVVQQASAPGPIRRIVAVEDHDPCPGYASHEVARSHTEPGLLSPHVTLIAPGELLLADFGVDWRHAKSSLATDPTLATWLARFESDDTYRIEIAGYSDCVGDELNNGDLRQGRARAVERLLGPGARSRLTFRGAMGLSYYVNDNGTIENRARNRSAVISFHQEMTFDEMDIEGHVEHCGPDVKDWLLDQMVTNADHPVIKESRDYEWPNFIPFFNIGWNYGRLRDFAHLVGTGRVWDFKAHWRALGWAHDPASACPTPPCERTVTMCDQCWNYDVPGNIHFGYIGRMAAIPPWLLHAGADWAQHGSWFDDPRDAEAIDIGIRMADDGTSLCGELRAHRGDLNVDGTQNCPACPELPHP